MYLYFSTRIKFEKNLKNINLKRKIFKIIEIREDMHNYFFGFLDIADATLNGGGVRVPTLARDKV